MRKTFFQTLTCCAIVVALGLADAQTANAQRLRWRFLGGACSSCRGGSCPSGVYSVAQPSKPVAPCQPAEVVKPCGPVQACAPTKTVPSCSTCPGGTCPADGACPADAALDSLNSMERELIAEANRVRGRFVLKFDATVNRRSQYNANCQAGYCQLGHFSGDSNEIAGMGYGSARAAINGWLNSPAHRAILLRSNYTKVGASVRRGRNGVLYWSMNFGY